MSKISKFSSVKRITLVNLLPQNRVLLYKIDRISKMSKCKQILGSFFNSFLNFYGGFGVKSVIHLILLKTCRVELDEKLKM